MTKSEYWVFFWGSHPDEENDDCWCGEAFATEAEARAAFLAPTFSSHTPSRDVAFLELLGPEVYEIRKNPGFRPSKSDDREWRQEAAMQAGMAFGCAGYNDEMEY